MGHTSETFSIYLSLFERFLPNRPYIWEILQGSVFRKNGRVKVPCCRNNYFVVKFRDIFQIYHFLKDWVIKRDKQEILTFIYFSKKFLEVKINSFLFKD